MTEEQRLSSAVEAAGPGQITGAGNEGRGTGGLPAAEAAQMGAGTQAGTEQTTAAPAAATPTAEPAASTDTEHEAPAATTDTELPAQLTQQERDAATAGTNRQIRTVEDWMNAEENRPETAEERRKRERKEKSKRIIAAVSDGLSALGNLYFTTQYAPNMYSYEKNSATTAVGNRLDQQKAEREKKRDQYMNFSLRLGELEGQRARTLRELEAEHERMRLARERAQREAEEHQWNANLRPYVEQEQRGKADRAAAQARTARSEADHAPDYYDARVQAETALRDQRRTSAARNRATEQRQLPYSAWDENGNEHRFPTRESAEVYARQHGTLQTRNDSTTTTRIALRTPTSSPQTSTTTTVTLQGYAARPNNGDNTPPSRRNNSGQASYAAREGNTPPSRRRNNDSIPPSRR